MNKVFLVAGETSGDQAGAWFVKRHLSKIIENAVVLEAVGGGALEASGVCIKYSYDRLNVVGLFEIVKKIPQILSFLDELVRYIIDVRFTHVILIDFAGFNMRLGLALKKKNPSIKIIYLAPPQLWCWGAWRINKLKKISDELIVLFPFEVEWYKKKNIAVRYLGNPVFDVVSPFKEQPREVKFRIGIFPGSRKQELDRFMPFLKDVIKTLVNQYPALEIAIFVAPRFNKSDLDVLYQVARDNVVFVSPENRFDFMKSCVVALTKSGTVTLELGLLSVPTIVFYKTHWLTYFAAKKLVSIDRMALPNIISNKNLMPEFIQADCLVKNLVGGVSEVLNVWLNDRVAYFLECKKFSELINLF